MKHIFIIFLLNLLVSISFYEVYATNNVQTISAEQNTSLNIKGAKLIEKYLNSLLDSLNELQAKYNLENNKEIKEYYKTLDSMLILLSKIQNKDISKQKAEEIMKVIINELKPLNKQIKLLLKEKREEQKAEARKLKEKYYNLSLNLSKTLDKIIIKLYIPIRNKPELYPSEKLLLTNLRKLKISSNNLKGIEKLNLNSVSEIKKEILSILKEIKKTLNQVKK